MTIDRGKAGVLEPHEVVEEGRRMIHLVGKPEMIPLRLEEPGIEFGSAERIGLREDPAQLLYEPPQRGLEIPR